MARASASCCVTRATRCATTRRKKTGWKEALKKAADLIVIAGGDGTVGRVIRRVADRGIPIALLPSGTANNIARSLEQVERPFEELVRGWEKARRVKLDVGVAKGPWGERNFIEGVGFGLFAGLLASIETDRKPEKKSQSGSSADKVDSALRRLKKDAERSKRSKSRHASTARTCPATT